MSCNSPSSVSFRSENRSSKSSSFLYRQERLNGVSVSMVVEISAR